PPRKPAWPGVSRSLVRVPCHVSEVTLARMVMPRSRSRSLESSARSATRWFSRNAPDCCSSRSTSVVLPWSTWAMIATLRKDMREIRWRPGTGHAAFAAQYRQRAPDRTDLLARRLHDQPHAESKEHHNRDPVFDHAWDTHQINQTNARRGHPVYVRDGPQCG